MDLLQWVVAVSMVLQGVAAVLAARLIPLTGRPLAWSLVALAMLLMMARRGVSLLHGLDVVPDPAQHRGISETIALVISVLMVGGVYLARQIFVDRLEARRDQHVSEAQFHTLAAAAYDAIMVTDTDGRVMYWNPAAERLFGYSQREAVGATIGDLIVPSDLQAEADAFVTKFRDTYRGAMAGRTVELPVRRKDGHRFIAEHSISTVQVEGVRYAIGVIRDVSERKRAERRIADQVDELQRFHRLSVGRELRIREVSEQNRALRQRLAALEAALPHADQKPLKH